MLTILGFVSSILVFSILIIVTYHWGIDLLLKRDVPGDKLAWLLALFFTICSGLSTSALGQVFQAEYLN